MSFNFSNHAPTQTVWYTPPTQPGIGKLQIVFAGQTNKPYTNAYARMTAKTGAARRAARGKVDADTLEATLKIDRILFAKYVVTAWDGVKDTEGVLVEFDCFRVVSRRVFLEPERIQHVGRAQVVFSQLPPVNLQSVLQHWFRPDVTSRERARHGELGPSHLKTLGPERGSAEFH